MESGELDRGMDTLGGELSQFMGLSRRENGLINKRCRVSCTDLYTHIHYKESLIVVVSRVKNPLYKDSTSLLNLKPVLDRYRVISYVVSAQKISCIMRRRIYIHTV